MHLCKMYSCTVLQNTIVLASDQIQIQSRKSLETLSNSTLTIVSGQNV